MVDHTIMREVCFPCPECETELRLPETEVQTTCPACQTQLDVKSSLAYIRGLEAFDEGQKLMMVTPRRLRFFDPPQDTEAMDLFREAYSSLQLAFEGDLQEDQRQLGVEMMASMAQEFSKRWMVSDFEGQYWRGVMSELTSQNEYDIIQEKRRSARWLAGNLLLRWYWVNRQKQLVEVLKDLDRKLAILESQIDFIEIPRARNRNWTASERK